MEDNDMISKNTTAANKMNRITMVVFPNILWVNPILVTQFRISIPFS